MKTGVGSGRSPSICTVIDCKIISFNIALYSLLPDGIFLMFLREI